MNMQLEAKNYTSGADILAEAAARKKRLSGPQKKLVAPAKSQEESQWKNEKGKVEVAKQIFTDAKRIADLMAVVRERDLQVADLHATMLRQAEIISGIIEAGIESESQAIEAAMPSIKRPVMEIIEDVLKDYPGVTWEDVKGVRRTRDLIHPRHACVYAVYSQRRDLSYPQLAKIFRRDHTSLIFAVQKMQAKEAVNSDK